VGPIFEPPELRGLQGYEAVEEGLVQKSPGSDIG